jgi:hypothetical protein
MYDTGNYFKTSVYLIWRSVLLFRRNLLPPFSSQADLYHQSTASRLSTRYGPIPLQVQYGTRLCGSGSWWNELETHRRVHFWTVSSSEQRLCYPYNETMRRIQNTVNLYTDICSRCTKQWKLWQQQYLRMHSESDKVMPITTTLIPGVSWACVDATQRSLLNRPYGTTKVFQLFYIHERWWW